MELQSSMSSPHHQTPSFEQRNNFLMFLLGLHSLAAAITEQLKPTVATTPEKSFEPPAKTVPSESLLR